MELSIEQKQALDCLYGKNLLSICAVDREMNLLWNSLCFEQRHLLLLHAQISGSGTSFFTEAKEILLHDGNGCIRCTAEQMYAGEDSYFLLRFRTEPTRATEHSATIETLLACAAENRLTAGDAIYALGDMYRAIRSSNCGEMAFEAADRLLAACYRLLNQALRCEELSWYAAADVSHDTPETVVDLAEQAGRLSTALDRVAGDLLPHSYTAGSEPLWIRADEDRLFFALLAMYLIVRREIPGEAGIHIRSERSGDFASISMEAETLGEYRSPRVHPPTVSPTDDTVLSDDALIQRFCKRFHATLLRHKTEKGCVFSLRLPLADTGRFTFESPERWIDEGRYAPEWIMLSSLVNYRHAGRF